MLAGGLVLSANYDLINHSVFYYIQFAGGSTERNKIRLRQFTYFTLLSFNLNHIDVRLNSEKVIKR